MFDSDDVALLLSHGCRVLSESEANAVRMPRRLGYHAARIPSVSYANQRMQMHCVPEGQQTLFIMPHCEMELYDAILAANWSAASLARLAILGNSFREYADKNSHRRIEDDSAFSRILAVQPHAQGEFPTSRVRAANMPDYAIVQR